MEVILDSSELDDLIQKSVREHFAEVLSSVVCPVHDAALETIHIEGDSLDSLQMRIEGCCDEAMAAATQALDTTEEDDVFSPSHYDLLDVAAGPSCGPRNVCRVAG